jgi:hypothetical protein
MMHDRVGHGSFPFRLLYTFSARHEWSVPYRSP